MSEANAPSTHFTPSAMAGFLAEQLTIPADVVWIQSVLGKGWLSLDP